MQINPNILEHSMRKLLIIAALSFISCRADAQVALGTSASATNPQRSGDATTGLFSSASGAVSVSSGGTEMLRVTGTGVGIGTTSPANLLDVNVGDAQSMRLISDSSSLNSFLSSPFGNLLFSNNVYHNGSGFFYEKDGYGSLFQIAGNNGTFFLYTFPSGTAGGAATPVARFVVLNNGNIGIGTTSPAVSLDLGQETDAIALPVGTTGQRPTGVNGMVRYNSSTSGLEAYVNGAWVSLGGGIGAVVGSGGQLQCGGANCSNTTGSTTLNYCPYKGNVKTTASQGNYIIPSACLSATLTSMYVGGVASTSVAASTLYYIYLWNTSGTWVLDAETTGHATDSSTGIEIKSGDNTKTLVGMIHTDLNKKIMVGGQTTSGMADTNTVATWDNRIPTVTRCGFTTNRTSTATSATEVNTENRCYYMSWGDAAIYTSWQGGSTNTTASLFTTSIWIDGTGAVSSLELEDTANYPALLVPPGEQGNSEGFHDTVLKSATTAGSTITYFGGTGEATQQVYTVQ